MPEGDTLHKLAAKIRPGLLDRPITVVRERDRGELGPLAGKTIREVTALGKNLLIAVEPRWMVRVHLGLKGRYRTWSPSDPTWERAAYIATLTLVTDRLAFATFHTRHARVHRRDDPLLERELARLGPDLLAPDVDMGLVVSRARSPAHATTPLGVLLLDQRIAAGIGNIYRNEVLFVQGIHPAVQTRDVSDEALAAVFSRAKALMASNLQDGARATVGPRRGAQRQPGTPSLFVYRRRGLPCLRCSTRIERAVMGDQARSIYWCPRCQPAPVTPGR